MDVKSFLLLLHFAFCVCFEPIAKNIMQRESDLDSEFVSEFVNEVVKNVGQNDPTRVHDVRSVNTLNIS